jgi:hypothetical protein
MGRPLQRDDAILDQSVSLMFVLITHRITAEAVTIEATFIKLMSP